MAVTMTPSRRRIGQPASGTHRPKPADKNALRFLDPREPWLIPGVALLLSRLVLWGSIPFAAEDAYITFRYARNFAHGFGLVFNPGERVFGFSSPLWTVWTSAGLRLGAPPIPWTRATGLLADLVAMIAFAILLRRHASRAAAWCFAFFFAVWPYFGAVTISGMETPLMLALIALTALGLERRAWWTAATLGALGLVRPEGLVAAAVLALWVSWRDRLIATLLVGAGVLGLTVYYGSPIPQSMIAKSMLYGTPGPWAGRFWWDWLSPFMLGGFPRLAETGHLVLLTVLLSPAAVLGARFLRTRLASGLAAAILACLTVWLGYCALGVAFFWWYLQVPLAGLAALAATGFPSIAQGRGLYVSAGLLVAGLWTIAPQLYIARAQNEYAGFAGAAGILAARISPGQKVMLEPIGMIGYGVPAVVIDEVGLVSPQVARRRLAGPGWYADLVASEAPDWLVVRRGVLESGRSFAGAGAPFRNPTEREAIRAAYETVGVADSTSGEMALLVLRRR